jgi:putative ABC transport system permease protein
MTLRGQDNGRGAPPWWRSHLWRRAPGVLVHHASAFAALAIAGLLITLAASSGPFVTTAAASSALKDKLAALSPLATGLELSGITGNSGTTRDQLRADDRRRAAVVRLQHELGLRQPVFTLESPAPMIVNSNRGSAPVLLMARSGALGHVTRLKSVPGSGVWIADLTADTLGVRPGGILHIQYGNAVSTRNVNLRIKGIYRALDSSSPPAYWANFLTEILPQGVDPPPPSRYVLLSREQLLALAHRLQATRIAPRQGSVQRIGNDFALATFAELAVDPHGLTLAQARRLESRFAAVRQTLRESAFGQAFGCFRTRQTYDASTATSISTSTCKVASSLSSAVQLADASAASVSPGVSLLSGAGAAIALAVAAAAGFFLVRRRRTETALLFARGESTAAFGARTALEVLPAVLVGGAAGFAIALGLTGAFAPSGSIDGGTVSSALAHGGIALAAGLVIAVAVACAVFTRQFDSGPERRPWLRFVPWELPLLAVSLWLLLDVHSGGGLATDAKTGATHPTLAVFLFPLLMAAAVAGLLARALRFALRRSTRGTGPRSTPVFLVTRRLAAARGTLVVLAVVSAAAFAAYYYAEAVAASLARGVAEKAYIAYGGDVQGIVSDTTDVPRRFPYPATRVDYANQVATLGTPSGDYADVLAVDARSLGGVIHWYGAWGPDPRPMLPRLADPQQGSLPVLAAGVPPGHLGVVWLDGVRFPVSVVGTTRTFPGMAGTTPLLIVDRGTLIRVARARHAAEPLGTPQTYIWANGPDTAVQRALQGGALEASFISSIDEFRKDPDVVLAKRTLAYMRLIALAAGLLVLIGLVLYLQSRQRSQAIASAVAARMGLTRRAEIASLALELSVIALFAGLVGSVVAILSAAPIVGHIDPLANDPPAPTLAVPLIAILASAAALVVVAVAAGALVSFAARRTDTSEALRVA